MPDFPDLSYSYLYSDPPDPNEQLPPLFFNTLPYRKSRFHETATSTSLDVIERIAQDWSKSPESLLSRGCVASTGHMVSWVAPELPPELIPVITEMSELLLHYDDEIDALDAQRKKDTLTDYTLGLLSMWKLGQPPVFEYDINKRFDVLNNVPDFAPDVRSLIFQTSIDMITPQSTGSQSGMSFEEYKKTRMASSIAKQTHELVAYMQGLRVREEERQAVSEMVGYGVLSVSLSNDYYSFHREFDDHVRSGSLDAIHNAMALLMTEYGYTELEAGDILKREVLAAEKNLMEQYSQWEKSSVPKSDDLRSYLILFILSTGGANYWQAQTPRYTAGGFTTTAEDRARLLRPRRDPVLKLGGHPPPAALDGNQNETVNGESHEAEFPGPNGANGTVSGIDVCAPFQVADADEICMAPFNYIKALPGKNTLAKFINCLRVWFSVPDDSSSLLREITVMLFNSTLLLDDIEDGSTLRRGKPAAHLKFGLGQTVNTATFLHAEAVGYTLKHLGPDCLKIVLDEIKTLARGQALDLNWTFNKTRPTLNEYFIMVDHKTGGFFRLLLRGLCSVTGSELDHDLGHLITLIGRYYQIRDDYQNLASDEYTAKKGFCDDLDEGKFSFPVLHLLEHSPKSDELFKIIYGEDKKAQLSHAEKLRILAEMKEVGSLTYTLEVLEKLFTAMLETLDRVEERMGKNKPLRCLMLMLKL
ncbi:polyprenyl synthetase family protein [Aspergillus novofumigatus IBT 16806]|uniref:Geranylgeranyl pyrophosphate synthase n=1 Tax=Aspergillus novofumigatus (strain IBT 16806) TaxID=1392255 RepID=A0A2I1CN59_ASPN1|nr:geranylgeranyl pyrophosphate synthase [Aspergillus novofumigatus IBT 16806]PKX99064.1 geranylgeranyl pyrophosphate synthase [Aspergillus novofumigatus IBT 16806]